MDLGHRRTGTRWRYPPITSQPREISERFLSEDERVHIADLRRAGQSIRSIARELGRAASTISREVRRNADLTSGAYHPFRAQRRAAARRARSKEGKLRRDPELRTFVQDRLNRQWSPEQISRMLPQAYPDDPSRHLAHETIYQALYIEDRGGLRRSPKALRTGRTRRRRRRRANARLSRFARPTSMIAERPAEVLDRSVPGHWEGDRATRGCTNLSGLSGWRGG